MYFGVVSSHVMQISLYFTNLLLLRRVFRGYLLKYCRMGNSAKNELCTTTARIIQRAVTAGKTIITEDIDLTYRRLSPESRKSSARLSNFDYARFSAVVENCCYKRGAIHEKINPMFTSFVGKGKYANTKKLISAQAAAYVTARLGQGFSDEFNGKSTGLQNLENPHKIIFCKSGGRPSDVPSVACRE